MEINEKTLREFINKRKKILIESRHKSCESDQFYWWSGYQEILWVLELFLEGEDYE